MKMWVCKSATFDAAHYLPKYDGPCKRMHGHTYKVEIGVYGVVDLVTGMVIDLALLGNFLKENVVKVYDHRLLNDMMNKPTVEYLVRDTLIDLEATLNKGNKWRFRVRIWETPDSYAEAYNDYQAS